MASIRPGEGLFEQGFFFLPLLELCVLSSIDEGEANRFFFPFFFRFFSFFFSSVFYLGRLLCMIQIIFQHFFLIIL